jgi:hypothetical protein
MTMGDMERETKVMFLLFNSGMGGGGYPSP